MNASPGFTVVPGETCTRPCGWSMVTGVTQSQEPSAFREKASRTSLCAIPPSDRNISLLRGNYYMRRTNTFK